MKRKILIKLISNSYNNLIEIYANQIKVESIIVTNYYYFNGVENQTYGIKIFNRDSTFSGSFCVVKDYVYIFDVRNHLIHPILITLIDHNYNGLKIKKGEIIFG